MIITPDQELVDELMGHLRDTLYGKGLSFTALPSNHPTRADSVHLSDLDLCITRKFWEKVISSAGEPVKVDNKSILYMLTGVGFEMFLTGTVSHTTVGMSKVYEHFGTEIAMTPDFYSKQDDLVEIKTTRMYPNNTDGAPAKHGFPKSWERRMMGYSIGFGLDPYGLAILYIGAATLVGFRFQWEDHEPGDYEIESLLPRAKALQEALENFKATGDRLPPEPFAYNDDWECIKCPFNMLCAATQQTGKFLPSQWPKELADKYLEVVP